MKPVSYYYDKQCEKRVPVNELGETILDWGETVPGAKKEMTLFIKNETKDRLVIRQPYSLDEDFKITNYPTRLFGEESGKISLSFHPNTERITPLKSGWGFEIVIG